MINSIKLYPLLIFCIMLISCAEQTATNNSVSETDNKMNPIDQEQKLSLKDSNSYRLFSFVVGNNVVAISPLPGKVNLDEDIALIKSKGITNIVTLVSQEELNDKNLQSFFAEMKEAGLEVYHSPIVDYGLPAQSQMDSILNYVNKCLDANQNVLIHCMGGYGRSGTVMGCYAQKYLSAEDPIQFVRDVRGEDAIETVEQEKFVINY